MKETSILKRFQTVSLNLNIRIVNSNHWGVITHHDTKHYNNKMSQCALWKCVSPKFWNTFKSEQTINKLWRDSFVCLIHVIIIHYNACYST